MPSSGSVLNLNDAYNDGPLFDDEPMFRPTSRSTGSGRSTPQALDWKSSTPPSSSPLRLLDRPSTSGEGDFGRMRSPLGLLPAPTSPPPRYSSTRASDKSASFPSDPKTPYEVLGVSEYATQEEIKKAYKRLALAYHPDRCHGDEAAVEEATRRFKLIAEAYAILGLPERRAEYNISRRHRSSASSSSNYRPQQTPNPSFKSSFMPSKSTSAFDDIDQNEEDTTLQDLRYLDPFSLFASMFPQYASQFAGNPKVPARGRGQKFSDTFEDHSGFADGLGTFLNDPLLARPHAAEGRKSKSNQYRTVTEKQEKAHMDRHGRLQIYQNEKTMKVHKSGGFTYSSTSFSGSFGPGNGNMLATLMSGGMLLGPGGHVRIGGSFRNMPDLFGAPDFGGSALPAPRQRVRRSSLGALDEHSGSAVLSSRPSAGALVSRPSFGRLDSYDSSPPAHALGDDFSLNPYRSLGGHVSNYGGW